MENRFLNFCHDSLLIDLSVIDFVVKKENMILSLIVLP